MSLEHSIGRLLTVATLVGVVALVLGVVAMMATGVSPMEAGPSFDLVAIPGQLARVEPGGLLWVGLLVVIATPPLRVAAALVGYAARSERRMTIVSILVLGVIAAGIAVGLVQG